MPCPFAFAAAQPGAAAGGARGDDDGGAAAGKRCPFSGKAVDDADGETDQAQGEGRFDYNKDPVSWFYQNQIRSEEEFQAKKAKLREQAKLRLEEIMHRKNKRIVWQLEDEDDDWSVCSSELSAWDSDVDSVSSLVSCAEDWKERSAFPARAEAALKYSCCAALAVVVGCMRVAWLSYAGFKQFWGVLDHRGTCLGTAAVSCLALLSAGLALQAWAGKSKRLLLAMQLSAHLLFASALATAVFAHTFPTRVNEQIKQSACQAYSGSAGQQASRLCQLIPAINTQLGASCWQVVQAMGAAALLGLALMLVGTAYLWELAHVAARAAKHKRRYKRRQAGIPWHKLKIEGPMTFCGQPPAQPLLAAEPKDKDA